jgi:hypothetical protein
MIINKITVGFVIQEWDTEKKRFVGQAFIAGDQVDYENKETGEAVKPSEVGLGGNAEGFTSTNTGDYLPFDMVQPTQ